MSNSEYISYETHPKPEALDRASGIKEFSRAKWIIMTILVINLLYSGFMLFGVTSLYRSGYHTAVVIGAELLYMALWLLGCWQLTRMPQKSFRMGGWLLGAYTIYGFVSVYLANVLNEYVFAGSSLMYFGGPILSVIGFFIFFLGILAFNWNDGANFSASSLIVAMKVVILGMNLVYFLPFSVVGNFASEISYFSVIVQLGIVWAWWMFFKYTSPEAEYDSDALTFGRLVGSRVFIGVTVAVALMLVTLPFIAKVTLNS